MKKLEVHVIELAEWCYSEVVQANKMRGNNEYLPSMAYTRLGSHTNKERPGHIWHRTSGGIISKVSCTIFKN